MRTPAPLLLTLLALLLGAAHAQLPRGAVGKAPADFVDVPAGHWAQSSVELLVRRGILTGYPDGTFRGGEVATRYESAAIAARLFDQLDLMLQGLTGRPDIVDELLEAAPTLTPLLLDDRVDAILDGMEEAASLAYARSLERRIVELERELNAVRGDDAFPARMTPAGGDIPLSAAEAAGLDALPRGAAVGGASAGGAGAAGRAGGGAGTVVAAERSRFYVGVTPGLLSTAGVSLEVHAGANRLLGPVGVRFGVGFSSVDQTLGLGVDALARVPVFSERTEFFGGFGLGLSVGDETHGALSAPFGMEYAATERIGFFVQIRPSYAFRADDRVDAAVNVGVNLYF